MRTECDGRVRFYRIPLSIFCKEGRWIGSGCAWCGLCLLVASVCRGGHIDSILFRWEAWQVCFCTLVPELEMRFPAFRSERQPVEGVDTANPNADAFAFAVSDVAIYLYTTSAASGFSKACKSWSCPSLI